MTTQAAELRHYQGRLQSRARDWIVSTLATLFYATVLFYAYRDFVSPIYAYEGLTFREPDPLNYGIALGVTCLLAGLLPTRIRRPSHFIQWLLFLTAGAPTILLSQYMNEIPRDEALRLSLVVAGCTLLVRIGAHPRPTRRRLLRVTESSAVWLFLGGFAALIYVVLIFTVGVSFTWVSLLDVYDVRSEFKAAASPVPFLGYLLPVLYHVINPTFMARGAYSGRWRWFLAGAGGQVLIFMTTGQKAILFSTAAILAIAWLFKRDLRLRGVRLLTAVSIASFGALALDRLTNSSFYSGIFIRRFMVVPGALTVSYVAVFHDRVRANFGNYLPGVDYPYSHRGPSYIVGESLTGNPLTNANVNLWGDGYFQYGYLGMVFVSILLVGVLWLTDLACQGLPTPVASLILFMPGMAVSSASLFTSLSTHGYAAALIICAVLPRTGWGRSRVSPGRPAPSATDRHAAATRGTPAGPPSTRGLRTG